MKVTGYTGWKFGTVKYKVISNWGLNDEKQLYEDARKAVIDDIRDNGYHFSGHDHQNSDVGVPVLDDRYLFQVTMRSWGCLMADAYPDEDYGLQNSNGEKGNYRYCKWAWYNPELVSETKYPDDSRMIEYE